MAALNRRRRADIVVTGIVLDGPADGIEFIVRVRNDEAGAGTRLPRMGKSRETRLAGG